MENVYMKPRVKVERYPAYKDTGIEWLGEMPEHWQVLKGKRLFRKEERPVRPQDDIVTCFRDGQVTLRSNRRSEGFTNALKEHGYQGIRKGDLVIHNMDAFAGAVGVSDSDGKSTPVYSVCTPLKTNFANPYYYAYFMRDLAKSGYIESLAKGIRERSTDFRFNDFGVLLLPVPTYAEQTRIAEFLDKKTAQIDQAIAQKERQIELLKERRQILIHNAVTRGLNPNVKMKDSGVEWIEEIPEHWEVKRLKYIGYLYPGITGKKGEDFSKEYVAGMKPFIPFTNIFKYDIISNEEYQFVKIRDAEQQNKVEKNDLLFLMSSETNEDIGKNSLYLGENQDLYLNSFCKGFRITKSDVEPLYINYLLLSDLFRGYFSLIGRGFTRINIKQEYVNDVKVLLPPSTEQAEIAEHVVNITGKVTTAIQIKQQEIDKLKEYKVTLINAAVTGKIKV